MQYHEIYLLRHGEIDPRYRGRFVGQIDVPLTGKGIDQARSWKRALADTSFGRIYCSDLVRSRRTAEIIAGTSRDCIEVVSQLREIDLGEWDGMYRAEVKSRWPEEWDRRGVDLAGYCPHGGESFADLSIRVVPVFQGMIGTGPEKQLIVGHAGVNRVILCHVLGMPLANLFRLGQDYGCLNIIECDGNSFRLMAMNMPPQVGADPCVCPVSECKEFR